MAMVATEGGDTALLGGVATHQGRMVVVVVGALEVGPIGAAQALVHQAQGRHQVC